MKIGVFRTSLKENEKRVPIYPEHLPHIPAIVKQLIYLEKGYGEDFGYVDSGLKDNCAGFLERDELFNKCEILILPKPTIEDLKKTHKGQILWGWAHCVQQFEIAQIAIERKITIIAWEAMHNWINDDKDLHIFYKNNELAGYASVIHSLELLGMDGHYGPRKNVMVIGYGSVSRGAIYALQGRGFNNIHVFTKRATHLVAGQNPDVYYYHFYLDNDEFYYNSLIGDPVKMIDRISVSDIIINGVLQDPNNPVVFIKNDQLSKLNMNSLIIDISCDEKMGFEFAKPTTFKEPMIFLENNIKYYSVDHAPSYLWNAASREISKALLPFLINLVRDGFDIKKDITLRNAIEIENGIIRNRDILLFQKRKEEYPHSKQ